MKRLTKFQDCSNGMCGIELADGIDIQTALIELDKYQETQFEPKEVAVLKEAYVSTLTELNAQFARNSEQKQTIFALRKELAKARKTND